MITFKHDTDEFDFYDPSKVEPRLVAMIFGLSWFMDSQYGRSIVVTSLVRGAATSPGSPHTITVENPRCRAADLRCKDIPTEQIEQLKKYGRLNFPRSDQEKLEANPNSGSEWCGSIRHEAVDTDNEHLHCCAEPIIQFHKALGVDG